jgi:hypothetical protein
LTCRDCGWGGGKGEEEEGIGFGVHELMRMESKYKLANSSLTNISTLKTQNLTKPIKTTQLLLPLSMYIFHQLTNTH